MEAILLHHETSTRRALILALGTYSEQDLTPELLVSLTTTFLSLYRNDPDCGIHGAAEWALRKWKREKELREIDLDLMKQGPRSDRRWYVNGQGQTLAIIDGPVEFLMGSPPSESHRQSNEVLHRRIIPRRFAVATREVSLEQFEEFLKDHPDIGDAGAREFSPDSTCPVSKPSWYAAAAFCNWLSDREKLQRCYEPTSKGEYDEGMTIPADALIRTGYRLLTEAEWEFSCRAGSLTSRYYGTDSDMLKYYAWFNLYADGRAWPCATLLPNDLGLFDMLGNLYEWCHDRQGDYQIGSDGVMIDQASVPTPLVKSIPHILRGGGFVDVPGDLRAARRAWNLPYNRLGSYGFRIGRTLP
jgi:formylglycine-generating enzyme required for sulfatase activity